VFFLYNNGFNTDNFLAKLVVTLLLLFSIYVLEKILGFIEDRHEEVVNYSETTIAIFSIILIVYFILNKGFEIDFYNQEQKYSAFEVRKSNQTDTYIDYDIEIDRYGEKKVEYEQSYYIHSIEKKDVILNNTTKYENTKKRLSENNYFVGEKKYRFWQTAVIDGYNYTEKNNTITMSWYYFLGFCYDSIPFIIFIIFLELLIMFIYTVYDFFKQ
jgi:hypothetical protein